LASGKIELKLYSQIAWLLSMTWHDRIGLLFGLVDWLAVAGKFVAVVVRREHNTYMILVPERLPASIWRVADESECVDPFDLFRFGRFGSSR
jgi:hypothetical protein